MHCLFLTLLCFEKHLKAGNRSNQNGFEKLIRKTFRTRAPRFSTNTVMVKELLTRLHFMHEQMSILTLGAIGNELRTVFNIFFKNYNLEL